MLNASIMKISNTLITAILPLVLVSPTIARASVTLNLGNMAFASPTTVTIANTSPALTAESVYSGEVTATSSDTTQPFDVWCINTFLSASLNSSNSSYTRETGTQYPGATITTKLLSLATESLGLVNNSLTSSAFQLAAWAIVNDTSGPYNLSTGNFTATNASDGSIALANTWLANLPGSNTPNAYSMSVLYSATNQDFAVFTAVPEPGTLALLSAALLGVAASRRKATKQA